MRVSQNSVTRPVYRILLHQKMQLKSVKLLFKINETLAMMVIILHVGALCHK